MLNTNPVGDRVLRARLAPVVVNKLFASLYPASVQNIDHRSRR
jgi:hypothetical protein